MLLSTNFILHIMAYLSMQTITTRTKIQPRYKVYESIPRAQQQYAVLLLSFDVTLY